MGLSTHVLNTATGKPAAGVTVHWEQEEDGWQRRGTRRTDRAGRVPDLAGVLTAGVHRLVFEFGEDAFFPEITVTIRITAPAEHHHVPLLLSPFGYTTYRGS